MTRSPALGRARNEGARSCATIAPWRSTYKINLLSDTDVHYLLVSGGHNAGIVSPIDGEGRHYRPAGCTAAGPYVDPDTWLATTTVRNSAAA